MRIQKGQTLMTTLTITSDHDPNAAEIYSDFDSIAASLAEIGVEFEHWRADHELAADAGQDTVLAAYRDSIDRLNKRYGFRSIDVVSLTPAHPDADTLRHKFLAEHTHADFEVRFFVDGSGLFYLHVGDRVYMVLCERGDLISVPANTTHWFDMGSHPFFKCIRFFTTPDGWVGDFTGSDIATRFPDYDSFVARTA
jgi:1,2-dihydroxy-3-keto-5-methylthiopentene dioxygenase